MKRGITLRRDRHGRRFALNFQIGYEGLRYDEENPPPGPKEPTLQELPPKTQEYAKSYGSITSYEQWLEREREEQRRINNSRRLVILIGLFIGIL